MNIKEDIVLENISISLLQVCLQKIKREDIRFGGILSSLINNNNNINKSQIYLMERYLHERLRRYIIIISSIIVQCLVEGKLFLKKIRYEGIKTTGIVELNSTLIYLCGK